MNLILSDPDLYCFGEWIERRATDGEMSTEKRAAATPTGKMAKAVVDGSIVKLTALFGPRKAA